MITDQHIVKAKGEKLILNCVKLSLVSIHSCQRSVKGKEKKKLKAPRHFFKLLALVDGEGARREVCGWMQ